MEKLPSKNCEILLFRIRNSEDGKLPISSLSATDRDRLQILKDHELICGCDPYFPQNDPNSAVFLVGPLYNSVTLTTAGEDYLSELSAEKKAAIKRFSRDVLMLIIGAIITLAATFFFNKLTGLSDQKDAIPVEESGSAFIALPPDFDFVACK